MAVFSCAALVFAAAVPGYAQAGQLEDKEIPVSQDFNAIFAQGDFEVTLAKGTYGVRLTVDKELAPYVEVYVKARTLHFRYNEKEVPKEVKKLYKGKNAPKPVFRTVVHVPEIESISLEDNASLTGTGDFVATRFSLDLTGKSQVKGLTVSAVSAKVTMKKSAQAFLSLRTDNGVEVNMEGSANAKLTVSGKEFAVNAAGSSIVSASGDTGSLNVSTGGSAQASLSVQGVSKAIINAENSSKVVLSGTGERLTVRGNKSANVDAGSFPVRDVEADLAHTAQVMVNLSGTLDVTLVGGSALYYTGSPEFKIRKIVKSTLAPLGTK